MEWGPGRLGGQRCGAGQPRAWGLELAWGDLPGTPPYWAPHCRIHTGDRPYKCPHPGCERLSLQLSNLRSECLPALCLLGARLLHTLSRGAQLPPDPAVLPTVSWRQHNKDKPYKCPNCYRAYSDSASLQIHLSAHAIKHAKAYCCSMWACLHLGECQAPGASPSPPGPSALY